MDCLTSMDLVEDEDEDEEMRDMLVSVYLSHTGSELFPPNRSLLLKHQLNIYAT